MAPAHRFGPIEIRAGRRQGAAIIFDISVNDRAFRVEVEVTPDSVTARWLDAPTGGGDRAAAVPVTFRVDGNAHGPFTLPVERQGDWVEGPIDEATLRYVAGGLAREWAAEAGGTVTTSCPAHAPNCCASFPTDKVGVAVVALAATRIRPVLQGLAFDDPLPWELTPRVGTRTGRVFSGGDGEGTLVGELQLYDKLVDAVDEATRETGGLVEFGIVEHAFAYANVDDYRFLYDRFGHISVDHPLDYTLSGYLGQLLGHLSRRDEVVYMPGHGTGYWEYNGDISHWGLPGGDSSSTVSWAEYASSHGWHPKSWPAASLLWGEEAVAERSWTGHLGPGESPPGVTADTLPSSASDPRLEKFVQAFDVTAAFGADARPIVHRIRANWEDEKGLPRDVGLLRAALGHADLDDAAYVAAVLDRLRQLV